jgi:MYXO-CTERM domain-containing protein
MPIVNRRSFAIRFIAAETLILPLLIGSLSHIAAAATTVACIGEQTTKPGEGVTAAQMWPAVLGTLLGATYTVGNDVMNNGNTVTAGDCVTAASKAGPPGIVVIGPFAEHDYAAGLTETVWQADYQKVVNQYLALMPPPTVYVMTPPPAAFVYQSAAEQTFATDVVKPAVLAVAAATANVHVIDLFSDSKLATGAGDGHFSVANHAEVAQLAYNAIKGIAGGNGGAGGAGGASAGAGAGGTTSGGSSGAATGGASTGGAGTGGASGANTGGTSAAGAAVGGSAGATVASAGSVATAGSAAIAGGAGAPSIGGSGGSPSSEPASSSDSSGCAIVAHSATRSPAGWLALLGGALLLGRRRRRSGPAA